MKEKVWPRLELESLTEDERQAVLTAGASIIAMCDQATSTAKHNANIFNDEIPERFVFYRLVRERLQNKVSSDPKIFLNQICFEELSR